MRPKAIFAAVTAVAAISGAIWWTWPVPAPQVSDALAIPMHGSQSVMVTLSLTNSGDADRLTGVSAAGAKLAVLKSPRAAGLTLPARSVVSLAPEAGHIMLMGIDGELVPGRTLPFELEFERAGKVATRAMVADMAMDHGGAVEAPADAALTIAIAPEPDGYLLTLDLRGITMARDLVDGPHVPGTGHAHVYVEGAKLGRLFDRELKIAALPDGRHRIEVVMYSNDHRAYHAGGQPVAAAVEVQVD